ncbi:MAG: YicC family protein [Candidatus Latescibacteria bacterium]|nr:YicC family protein [Candidatus Latescibacterota bacterium]
MIRSMTGFGKGEAGENGVTVTVEVSSVNGRFLDLRTKLPRILNEYESGLRKMVQEHVGRGRVQLSVSFDRAGLKAQEINVDFDLAKRYIALAGEISEQFGVESNMDARTVLSLPETIGWNESCLDAVEIWRLTQKAAQAALEAHRGMREREGAAMGADLEKRLAMIMEYADDIRKRAPDAAAANAERLRGKIEALMGKGALDENRFSMEVALYSDRVDVTEECVRLGSHCEQFGRELQAEKTSGKKLSFLLQEMNREANTIASKIMNAEISRFVVGVKEELEKMREQAENME